MPGIVLKRLEAFVGGRGIVLGEEQARFHVLLPLAVGLAQRQVDADQQPGAFFQFVGFQVILTQAQRNARGRLGRDGFQ